MALTKFRYYQSKPRAERRRAESSFEVSAREYGTVSVGIAFSDSIFATELTPEEARTAAAAMIERADDADREKAWRERE
jgi:hypothetical protein